jgi:hypothetical protein
MSHTFVKDDRVTYQFRKLDGPGIVTGVTGAVLSVDLPSGATVRDSFHYFTLVAAAQPLITPPVIHAFKVGDKVKHFTYWYDGTIAAKGDWPGFWWVRFNNGDDMQWHEDNMSLATPHAAVKACTCGGAKAKTTHAAYCDSRADATVPFKMPERLSF